MSLSASCRLDSLSFLTSEGKKKTDNQVVEHVTPLPPPPPLLLLPWSLISLAADDCF